MKELTLIWLKPNEEVMCLVQECNNRTKLIEHITKVLKEAGKESFKLETYVYRGMFAAKDIKAGEFIPIDIQEDIKDYWRVVIKNPKMIYKEYK